MKHPFLNEFSWLQKCQKLSYFYQNRIENFDFLSIKSQKVQLKNGFSLKKPFFYGKISFFLKSKSLFLSVCEERSLSLTILIVKSGENLLFDIAFIGLKNLILFADPKIGRYSTIRPPPIPPKQSSITTTTQTEPNRASRQQLMETNFDYEPQGDSNTIFSIIPLHYLSPLFFINTECQTNMAFVLEKCQLAFLFYFACASLHLMTSCELSQFL